MMPMLIAVVDDTRSPKQTRSKIFRTAALQGQAIADDGPSNCWPLDNWVTPSAKIGSRPNKSPKRKKSENHHHHRRAGVRRWRRIRRPPARSIHRRQLPVRLLLDGILLRAGRRTGRGRETSGRQLPEWLARIGQQLFKERRPD